jgi:hypothetical protein
VSILLRVHEKRAAPHWACDACGPPIVRRGVYGWKWPDPEKSSPVSLFHLPCRPEGMDWQFAPLQKLSRFLGRNFLFWHDIPLKGQLQKPLQRRRKKKKRPAPQPPDEYPELFGFESSVLDQEL